MLGLKLNHVSKRGHWSFRFQRLATPSKRMMHQDVYVVECQMSLGYGDPERHDISRQITLHGCWKPPKLQWHVWTSQE